MIQQKTRKDRNSVCYKVRFLKPVLSEPSSCKSRKNLRHCHQLCSVLPSRVNPLPNELKKDLKHLWSCQSYLRYQSVIVFVHRLLSGSYFFSFGHTSDACYSAPRCGGLFVLLLQILSLMMEIESAFRLIFNLESKWWHPLMNTVKDGTSILTCSLVLL